jgi:divalent anion:Na+ symporter, DASS family
MARVQLRDDAREPEAISDARAPSRAASYRRELNLVALALLYVAIVYLVPRPASVTAQSWKLFGIFAATILGMITQPVPAAALVIIGTCAFVVIGGVPIDEALAGFSSAPVWLLLGAMLMARTLIDTGLSRRLALLFVRRFGRTSLGVAYSLVFTDLSLAGVVPSISARSGGIILPIARAIGELYESSAGRTAPLLGTYLMAALYQSSVVACAMFLTGQAGNVLAAGLAAKVAGVSVTWASWLTASIAPGLASLAVMPYLVYRLLPPVIKSTPAAPEYAQRELDRMGRPSGAELGALLVIATMCVLWASGGVTGINATVVALVGICALMITNILKWESVIGDRATWDVFMWYGGLVMMGEKLNQTGVPAAFAAWVGSWFLHAPWFPVLIVTLLIYFYAHYGFATVTVHVLAMFPPFVALLVGLGAPPKLTVYGFACLTALSAGLTHYGTTTAPLYAKGYVTVPDWWRVGLVASLVNLLVWLTIGFAWWKLLGFW